jgi:hypothetical protein
MPFGIIFHERNALAFYGVGHDGSGLPVGGGACLFQSRDDLREIVAINFYGAPAEGAEFIVILTCCRRCGN